jgi:hypothetical protein
VGKIGGLRNADDSRGGKTVHSKFFQKGVAILQEKTNKAPAVVIRNWWTPQDNVWGSLKPGSREQASIPVR